MSRSVKVLIIYIAFIVHLSFTNPHCSSAISGVILFLILAIRIFSNIFVMWLMRLIVRCDSHSVAPGFFDKAMKTRGRCSVATNN